MEILQWFLETDIRFFLFLNGLHNGVWDVIMPPATRTLTWVPLYGLCGWWIIKKYGMASIYIAIGVTIGILMTNELTTWIKVTTGRVRPCYNTDILYQIHALVGCGGRYEFPSAHAANSFFLWFFLKRILFFREKKHFIVLAYALLTTYSRVYLGVHYPFSLLVGAFLGMSIGAGVAYLSQIGLRHIIRA